MGSLNKLCPNSLICQKKLKLDSIVQSSLVDETNSARRSVPRVRQRQELTPKLATLSKERSNAT
ncbi:MAG: hypothetical protein CMJ78_06560 [Planctomycetaceae bacterium]|nr:hypothetical protein [Planctomycetaceae bacterium]